jgi:hypothetical protein
MYISCMYMSCVSARDFTWESQCIVALLKNLKNDFVSNLFIDLLDLFTLTKEETSLLDIRYFWYAVLLFSFEREEEELTFIIIN